MDQVPVKPADPHVIRIGQFAVEKYNENRQMKHFVAVVGGFRGPVSEGTINALIIETQDDNGDTFLHKALVLAKPDGSLNPSGYWV